MRWLLPALCLLLFACAPKVQPPPSLDLLPASRLMEALIQQKNAYNSLEAEVKLRLQAGEKRLAATQLLWVRKPASLRGEVLNPFGFGAPLLQFASDGETLSVFSPGRGQFYQGDASARNLMRFTRIPLQVEDLVRVLLLDVPLLPYGQMRSGSAQGQHLLSLEGAGQSRQDFLFDEQLRLLSASYSLQDEVQLIVSYGDFGSRHPSFPGKAALSMPGFDTRVEMEFASIRIGAEIPESRFALQAPPGTPVLPIP